MLQNPPFWRCRPINKSKPPELFTELSSALTAATAASVWEASVTSKSTASSNQTTGLDCVHICRLTHGDDGSVARRCKGLGNGPTDAAAAASDQHGVSGDVRTNLGCHGTGSGSAAPRNLHHVAADYG